MTYKWTGKLVGITIVILVYEDSAVHSMSDSQKRETKETVEEMFNHAYGSYMKYAFPADELMPLSCKGRYRGTEPSRGDVDDTLGNFTLTLIDTLDTLAVLGQVEKFETAVQLVIDYARFDSDIIVSVFETNIRVLGGLLGGHVMAAYFKRKRRAMEWYNGELLVMAKEVGYRLLPALNTTTGIPYPRINLKYGMEKDKLAQRHKDTCTACAGTMILEFAALSRLTGDPVFEEKAHKVMDYLWQQRHSSSDLLGTVINVHSGDWIRREAGVGAGTDSYYEYVLKAYVLLGDEKYLYRFDRHYNSIMKYMSKGPMLVDVHMHKPTSSARHFMDALLAFWPGLQVLKGDISPAIKTHEMLYQVIQRHNFLPEAFTTDFKVHWGQHPLRPEFVESTYFLYKATHDPHYLQVGRLIVENLNKHARVPCGFAAIKDVVTGKHEDQLDSFVLAETFKYLYLLFSEERDLVVPVNEYIFTTEAHLLPLTLSLVNSSTIETKVKTSLYDVNLDGPLLLDPEENSDQQTCPNPLHLNKGTTSYAFDIRTELKDYVNNVLSPGDSCIRPSPRLHAADFVISNREHQELINRMGIKISTMSDGRLQLLHSAGSAASKQDAEEGLEFMKEMIELSQNAQHDHQQEPMTVQFVSNPFHGSVSLKAGPAQFGYNLKVNPPIFGQVAIVTPYDACHTIQNPRDLEGKIGVLERGSCMFMDKARRLQAAGAIGGIVIDNNKESTAESSLLFAMSGDGQSDVVIPLVFLFFKEGQRLLDAAYEYPDLELLLTYTPKSDVVFNTANSEKAEPLNPGDSEKKEVPTEIHTKVQVEAPPSTESTQVESSSNDKSAELNTQATKHVQSVEALESLGKTTDTYSCSTQYGPAFLSVFATTLPGENSFTIIRNKDNTVDLRFHLFQVTENRKPEINTLYVQIVEILRQRTNFLLLEKQEEYLIALARMLEAAIFQVDISHDTGQNILKLTGLLQVEEDPIIISGPKDMVDGASHLYTSQSKDKNQSFSCKRTNPLLKFSERHCPLQKNRKVTKVDSIPQKQASDGV
ncbi:ER degradation-enhancing alpha-mannosidase-like protein 3 [Saccostrea echinata]|uniref:ER degradation-enhancing alpha-mannosidase-like protein 3 n=1 Tax=Saccostrea echinata TaxID=191078 RepID=UPI002A7EFC55|nr:ER degradation-enhancing alpha-mannosidase-like protein 3 [Saccostrea echinata]